MRLLRTLVGRLFCAIRLRLALWDLERARKRRKAVARGNR